MTTRQLTVLNQNSARERLYVSLVSTVKRSREYRLVRSELADPVPVDIWYENGVWFLVFEIKAVQGGVIVFVVSGNLALLCSKKVIVDQDLNASVVSNK